MINFFNRIFEWDKELTEGEKYFFRLIEVILIGQIIYNTWNWAFYIKELTGVILPLGLANYIDITIFFGSNLAILNASIIAGLLFVGFFRKWKHAYLVTLFFFHLEYVARFSQGEISHGTNLAGMILLCIGVSFSFIKNSDHIIKSAFGLMYFFIGLGYVFAACSKLIGTGINWADGDHLILWIAERGTDKLSQNGAFSLNRLQVILLENYWLATITLAFGLLTELTGFLLWFKKTRWIQTTILLSMHIGIVFTLNIYFGDYVYLLILLGYPWDKLINYFIKKYSP
tara:strand:- start:4944 stop:5801 length:858 start_codon:yes stop_codon:yes gene_type:complete